jgi:hypothetical protein
VDALTLAPGDRITVSLDKKTYTGVVRYVVRTFSRDYQVVLESDDSENTIDSIQVSQKFICYPGF